MLRPWQCDNDTHNVYYSEQLFLEHLVEAHGFLSFTFDATPKPGGPVTTTPTVVRY